MLHPPALHATVRRRLGPRLEASVLRLCGDLSAVFGRTFLSQARMSREEEDLLRSVMEESVRAAALER